MNAREGKRRSLVILILSLAVLVAAVLVTERFHVRLDLTSDHAYTLSTASRDLYKSIPERVRVTYYVSPLLSSRHPGPRAIQDFLEELAAASHGKIAVEVLDPAAGSGDQAAAVESLGVQPQRMQIVEQNEQRVALVYSGIVVQYLDRTKVLPFVIGVDTLEYDMVKAITSLVTHRSSVAAVIVGDPDKSLDTDYRTLSDALHKNGWEVQEIHAGDPVPPEAGVLIVLGNSGMDDYAAYRIDAYIAGGGKAFFAVKGVDVNAQQGLTAGPLKNDALLRMLDAYGVKVDQELVLDSSALTVPFQEPSPYGGAAIRYVRYPHWIVTRPENRDATSPLSSRLAGLDLFWPSPLQLEAREGVTETALVRTSPKAWLQTKHFAVGPQDEPNYADEAGTTTGQYILAASLSGSLPMAYRGLPVPTRSGAAALPPLPATARPSRIVVVGSSDFATDLVTMTDSQFNDTFIADAADWLGSGDQLIAIKTRGTRDTRLMRITDPDSRSLAILVSYIVNLGMLPALVLVFGFLRAAKRRRLAREGSSEAGQDLGSGSEGDRSEGGEA